MHKIIAAAFSLLCALSSLKAASISGTVSNQGTGQLLRDATIEIPRLNRTLVSDELGRFTIHDLDYGDYDLIFSYVDLDSTSRKVSLSKENPSASLEVALTSTVYQLETFSVTGEREGSAAAIARQRSADNVKNVVSLDAMGQLSNENPAELLVQLAGISGSVNEAGDVDMINIRGIGSEYNTVTYDGSQMATSYGLETRSFRFLNINASTFEELEVIKAPTPNMDASSLSGTVNMKTKNTLNMKEKFRIDYRASVKYFPDSSKYAPRRTDKPYGPLFSFDYRQVFSIAGGNKNLGVYLNLFHTSNPASITRSQSSYDSVHKDYTALESDKTAITTVSLKDNVDTRSVSSGTLRFDYKLSDASRFYLTMLYSQSDVWVKPGMEAVTIDYTGNQSKDSSGTQYRYINPGYSDRYSEITNGTYRVRQGYIGNLDRQYRAQIGAEHSFSRLLLDYDLSFSRSDFNLDSNRNKNYAGKMLQSEIREIGAILQQPYGNSIASIDPLTAADEAKIYNPDSYAAITRLYHRQGTRNATNYEGKLNAKTDLSLFNTPVQTASGLAFRKQEYKEDANSRRWRYNQSTLSQFVRNIEIDPRLGSGALRTPLFDLGALCDDLEYNYSANWKQDIYDVYYQIQQDRNGDRDLNEDIYAAYLMARTNLKKLNILAGFRIEHTRFHGSGWDRVAIDPTYDNSILDLYERALDRADREYREASVSKSYTDVFPGIHLNYPLTKKLLLRASFSTSIGRPRPKDLVPGMSVNESTEVVSVTNPGLVPQYSNNYDLSAEYYFKPSGIFSVGLFRKDIRDFLYTQTGEIILPNTPGFDGQYVGYELNKPMNGKTATVEGIEISYEQPLRFLPPPLNGLSVALNYTHISTDSDYGSSGDSSTRLVGFNPNSANARLSYRYKRLSTSVSLNYQDSYLTGYSPQPALCIYRDSRLTLNAQASFRFYNALTLNLAVSNITNEPFRWYYGKDPRTRIMSYNGPIITVGISGRF